jgi:hypothetical protein
MFEISANITGGGLKMSNICCFDPTVVVVRLREAFPDVEIVPEDMAWRYYDHFKRRGAVEGAVRIAENDARRRGPIWTFRLPVSGGQPIRGRAERYDVTIRSEQEIPEPLGSRFIAFLEELRFAPCVSVKSIRWEGNEEFPA